jgi:hypothetical protein
MKHISFYHKIHMEENGLRRAETFEEGRVWGGETA